MKIIEWWSEDPPVRPEDLFDQCQALGVGLDVPYPLIEADAVFHEVSIEHVIYRYLLAKLGEASHAG